ncbi:MAG: hypothetical protein ACFB10_20790 [Salibacteraceae bacterium]
MFLKARYTVWSLLFTLLACQSEVPPSDDYSQFSLTYLMTGLQAGYGGQCPRLVMDGQHFVYTLEPNSFTGDTNFSSDTLLFGRFPSHTLDSLIAIVDETETDLINAIDPHVQMGDFYLISLQHGTDTLTLQLQNQSHPTAERVVGLLNAALPKEVRRIAPLPLFRAEASTQ